MVLFVKDEKIFKAAFRPGWPLNCCKKEAIPTQRTDQIDKG
jgi:hypothetical protein